MDFLDFFKKKIKINRKSGPAFNSRGVQYFVKYFKNDPHVKLKRLELKGLSNIIEQNSNNAEPTADSSLKYLMKIFKRGPVLRLNRSDLVFVKNELENEEIFPPSTPPPSPGQRLPDIVDIVVQEEIKPEVEIYSSWDISKETPNASEIADLSGPSTIIEQSNYINKNFVKCSLCPAGPSTRIVYFCGEENLRNHIHQVHKNYNKFTKTTQSTPRVNQQSKGRFQCLICDKKFNLPEFSRIHEQTHLDGFKCIDSKNCKMTFQNLEDLKRHTSLCSMAIKFKKDLKERHELSPINCIFPACSRGFFDDKDFLRHLKSYHGETQETLLEKIPIEKPLEKNGLDLEINIKLETKTEKNAELDENDSDITDIDDDLLYELHKPIKPKSDSEKSKKLQRNLDKCVECPICSKAYVLERSLKKHLLEKHRPLVFRSPQDAEGVGPVLPIKSEYPTRYYKYIDGLIVYEPYKCTECSRIFQKPYPAKIRNHLELHRKQNEGRKRSFICSICSKGYYDEIVLRNHKKWAHEGEGNEAKLCPHCGLILKNRAKFQNHLRVKHRIAPFKCTLCPHRFNSRASTLEHEKLHKRTKADQYVCSDCLKVYSSEVSLRSHRHYYHPTKLTHACPEPNCEQMFPGSAQLSQHFRKAHKKVENGGHLKKFKCPQCPLEYSCQLSLYGHLRLKHSSQLKVYEHKCPIEGCHLSFRSLIKLQTHEKNHKEKPQKPFLCTTCGKGFKIKTHLEYHAFTHDSKRNFVCKECEQSFKFPNHLTTHVKIYHNMNDQERAKYFQETKERRKLKKSSITK